MELEEHRMDDGERPVDLSPLDPMRDPVRWRAFVERTYARVYAAMDERAHGDEPLAVIASWRRPLLVAAAAAMFLLVGAELALGRRENDLRQVARLVEFSLRAPIAAPSGAEFRRVLGGPTP